MNRKIEGVELSTIYAKIVETSEQGICLLSRESKIVFVNDAFCRLVGYESSALIGSTVTHIIAPESLADFQSRRSKRIEGQLREKYELVFIHGITGKKVFVVNSVSPILDDNNQMVLGVGVLADVTAMKEVQFELAARVQELNESQIKILAQELALVASAKTSALGEMAGQAAHEINTPLGAIVLTAESLKNRIADNKFEQKFFAQQIELILTVTQKVARIISSMRKLAGQAGNEFISEVSIKTLVEDTLLLCEGRFKKNGISFEVKFDGVEARKIQCMPSEISQILINLLNNSNDAIQNLEYNWVTLSLKDSGGLLRLEVCDSGPPISPENRAKLFTPNFTTKSLSQGTGYGLSISSKIAERHHGRLFLDQSRPNTCFVLEIPWEQSEALAKTGRAS
jgi:PAS domain S-box-containing protein